MPFYETLFDTKTNLPCKFDANCSQLKIRIVLYLESLPAMVAGVYSDDSNLQLEATTQFQELLSNERSRPIEEVIQSGVVPRFVQFLTRDDFPQLQQVGVIATPDIHSFELMEKEQFIILGCDGLWGVFGPSDAVEFVQKQLEETASATTATRRLVKEAVRERRCKDNCTAIVIVFKH